MKYNLKYLVKRSSETFENYYYYICGLNSKENHNYSRYKYNIDDCELINGICTIKINRDIINLLLYRRYYINIVFKGRNYYGFSEKDWNEFKSIGLPYKGLKKDVKTIEEIIIEDIIE